ncbi:hypothetical protein HYR99_00915 [Candidatus Poribacteria bacterium]|nr:hypothetical protein [Candidatus Poribacteria bacterium]
MPRRAQQKKHLTVEQERQLNQRVARRLAQEMAETHKGQWIGLVRGEVVTTAPTLEEVTASLMKVEPDPRRGLVFRAGEDYRKKLIILTFRLCPCPVGTFEISPPIYRWEL